MDSRKRHGPRGQGNHPQRRRRSLGRGRHDLHGRPGQELGNRDFLDASDQTRYLLSSIDANICSPGSSSCGNSNSVTFTFSGGGAPFELTGNDLMTMYGALGEGLQGNALDNQLVTITGLPSFTSVTFASTGTAFEFSLVPIPEPSTWAMMALGFVGLGYAGYRQRRMLIGAANV